MSPVPAHTYSDSLETFGEFSEHGHSAVVYKAKGERFFEEMVWIVDFGKLGLYIYVYMDRTFMMMRDFYLLRDPIILLC